MTDQDTDTAHEQTTEESTGTETHSTGTNIEDPQAGADGASDTAGVAGTDGAATGEPTDSDGTDSGGRLSGNNLVTYVEYAAFAVLSLLALVATFRFYFAASRAIAVWFSSDFVPVFQAAFNLLVVVLAGLGISVLVRRLA